MLALGVACAALTPAAAQPTRATTIFDGALAIAEASGPECPPAARLERIQLALVESTVSTPRFTGTLSIGDELIKSVEGDEPGGLRLRDPLVSNEDSAANRLALNRWPDPTSATAGFQFFRHRCRIVAAGITLAPSSVAAVDAIDRARSTLSDAATIARVQASGRAGDPRPGVAELPGLVERVEARLGPRHAVTLEAKFVRMVIAQDTDDFSAATALGETLREALGDLYGRDSGQSARLLTSLAYTKWRSGRSAEAIRDTQAALAAIEARSGKTDASYLTALRTLAQYLALSGRYAEALDAATEAESTARAVYGEASDQRFATIVALVRAYGALGRAEDTRNLLISVLPLAREKLGIDSPVYADLVLYLSNAADDLQLHDEASGAAEFAYRQTEKRLGPNNQATVSALVNVASMNASQGRLDDAEKFFLDAYRRLPQSSGARYEQIPTIEVNLAALYLERGALDKAGPFVEAGVERARQYWGDHDPRTLRVSTSKGEWLRRTGDPRAAIVVLEEVQARQQERGGTLRLDRIATLSQLAAAHQAAGDAGATATRLEELVALAESQRSGVRSDSANRQRLLARWVADYKRLAAARLEQGRLADAFALAELSKGRTLLDQLSERSARIAGELTTDERRALEAAEADVAGLEDRLAALAPGAAESTELVPALAERRAALGKLKQALFERHPRYADLTRVDVIDADRARALLGPAELAISYLVVDDTLMLFVLTRDRMSATTLPITAHDRTLIDALAQFAAKPSPDVGERLWRLQDGSVQRSLAQPDPRATRIAFADLRAHVGSLLLGPIRGPLAKARRVLILPDSVLTTLPFELLTLDGSQLVSRRDVHYAQSMSVYARIVQRGGRSRPAADRTLLAFGAPHFGTPAPTPSNQPWAAPATRYRSAGVSWSPLPAAEREVRSIASLFPSARIFLGNEASEERLMDLNASGELERYRYIHFATHAFFSSDRPQLSAIVLRQPGSAQADGFVTVAELPRYRLQSDLVVLSACETAAGKIVDGEGVMGFAYGLLIAGNSSTVAALWKVPDDSTAAFMKRFFVGIREGASRSAALARAKRATQRDPQYAAPIHWAGFVLYGN